MVLVAHDSVRYARHEINHGSGEYIPLVPIDVLHSAREIGIDGLWSNTDPSLPGRPAEWNGRFKHILSLEKVREFLEGQGLEVEGRSFRTRCFAAIPFVWADVSKGADELAVAAGKAEGVGGHVSGCYDARLPDCGVVKRAPEDWMDDQIYSLTMTESWENAEHGGELPFSRFESVESEVRRALEIVWRNLMPPECEEAKSALPWEQTTVAVVAAIYRNASMVSEIFRTDVFQRILDDIHSLMVLNLLWGDDSLNLDRSNSNTEPSPRKFDELPSNLRGCYVMIALAGIAGTINYARSHIEYLNQTPEGSAELTPDDVLVAA